MRRNGARQGGPNRLVLVLAVLAGLLWVRPAQAGPAVPPPTVTITTAPVLGQSLPQKVHAAWTIDKPGVMATLDVEGDVLAHTIVTAVWTSPRQVIKHNDGCGGLSNSWNVTQVPVGSQSRQAVSVRMTTPRGTWGPWSNVTPETAYAQLAPNVVSGEFLDLWYDGPTMPRGQIQYRLVLTLEPGTHVEAHTWNVAG